MRFYFIDTNIMLDLVANREPFVQHAEQLFDLASQKKVRLYCSAISMNNIYYIVKKFSNHKTALYTLNLLRHKVNVLDLDKSTLFQAMDSDFRDFEDGIQYFSALTNKNIECIVTRNSKDFKQSQLPVLTPDLAVYNVLNEVI